MDVGAVVSRLALTLDAHAWDELPTLVDEDFRCRYVHSGEEFDRDGWVRLNASYPGFEHFTLEDVVVGDGRAAGRATVTSVTGEVTETFAVAMFLTIRGGLIVDLVEVWTDIGVGAAPERRPG